MRTAYVVESISGWFNVIVQDNPDFIWDNAITEPYIAALSVLANGMKLVDPPDNIKEKLRQEPLGMPNTSDDGTKFNSAQLTESIDYAKKHFLSWFAGNDDSCIKD